MPKPQKTRSWKRVLTLSVTPKKDVTTIPAGRTFFADVLIGEDGQPFFWLNSAFLEKDPKEWVRIISAMKKKQTFGNVYVNEPFSFEPFSPEGGASKSSTRRKATQAARSDEPEGEDLDFDGEDDDDFDA